MFKKLTLAVLSLLTVVSIFSCKKDTVVQSNPAASLYAYITPNQWQLNSADGYYYYDIDLSSINGYIYTQDATLLYGGTSNLSPTDPNFAPVLSLIEGDESDGGTWINNFKYTFNVAATQSNNSNNDVVPSIRIYVNGVNGTVVRPTANMYFNIVVIPADDYGQAMKYKENYLELKEVFKLK